MNKKLVKSYAKKMSGELGRKVGVSEAEAEIVRIIEKVVHVLAPSFRFGYHSNEDIEGEGVVAALEVLEEDKYDIGRPLENFLYTHVHNQLHNFKRKHYARIEPPCSCCDPYYPPAYPCQKWIGWQSRNTIKQNLMKPLDMYNIADETEINMRESSSVLDDTIGGELRNLLDRELPVELRRDYLQMLDGKLISKARRDRVKDAIVDILKEKGYMDATQEAPKSTGCN